MWYWNFDDGYIDSAIFNTYTHVYASAGTYNVMLVVRDTFSTDFDTIIQSVTVPLPNYSINTADMLICSGDSVVIFGNYYAISGTYYDSLITVNGCDSIIATTLTVNPLPTVNLGTDTMICNGCSITLDAGPGFSNYTWSTGDTTQSIVVNQAGTYTVQVTDANGCANTDQITVTVTSPSTLTITGNVSAGVTPVNNGQVTIYYDDLSGAPMAIVATSPLDALGNYTAGPITGVGNYIIMAEADTLGFPDAVPTFYIATHRWDSATAVIAVSGPDTTIAVNINIIEVPVLTGTSSLSGVIVTTGKKADPVPGVSISVEQIPGGVIASHTTDSTGTYSFNNVPQGNFTFHISVPGKEMETNYSIGLTTDDSTITGLNFLVGDSTITTTNLTTDQEEITSNLFNTKLYPNPYKLFTTFEYTIEKAADVTIKVYNMLGEVVFSESTSKRAAGTHSMRFGAKELGEAPGVYTINITVGDQMYSTMLVKLR